MPAILDTILFLFVFLLHLARRRDLLHTPDILQNIILKKKKKFMVSFLSVLTFPRLAEKYRESGRQSSLTPNKRTASDSKRSTPLSPRSEQVSRIDDTLDPAVRARKVTFNNYIIIRVINVSRRFTSVILDR